VSSSTSTISSSPESTNAIWAVIPAAGVGSRMGLDTPKQYAIIHGKTILEHSLSRLLAHPLIAGVVVAISTGDTLWPTLYASLSNTYDKPIIVVDGGKERCDSVLNGLHRLEQHIAANGWVLVHDAARPCVRLSDIDKLINQLLHHPVGGILATEVRDTMKRSTHQHDIIETVERKNLWHALTPQMFRLGLLKTALDKAKSRGESVTDEASAIELNKLHPKLITGCSDNIKVTRFEDLSLAEYYLKKQAEET